MLSFEEACIIHDRLMWDDIVEAAHELQVSSHLSNLPVMLDTAFELLPTPPQIIVLPATMALPLWDLPIEVVLSPECPVLRVPNYKSWVYGYLMTYRSVDVLVSWVNRDGWVSAVRDLRQIGEEAQKRNLIRLVEA